MAENPQVLVTGGSGFVGGHCIVQLLDAGYRVRTTIRSLRREAEVRAAVAAGGAQAGDRLTVVAADLGSDAGWTQAVDGCAYVLHVASPFPPAAPKHEDELIVPAREGTLRVLRAARDAGVKRTVLTSSFAAIGYGYPPTDRPFTEETWTNLDGAGVTAYPRSKTLAERAAWQFVETEGNGMELAVINPVAILGPVLTTDYSTSIQLTRSLLDGRPPRLLRLAYAVVDVRDVADLHLRAMLDPAAAGNRFLAAAGDAMTMQQIARVARERLGDAASRVPTKLMPDWQVRIAALFNGAARQAVPNLGAVRHVDSAKARRLLGWAPRTPEETIVATMESLLRLDEAQQAQQPPQAQQAR